MPIAVVAAPVPQVVKQDAAAQERAEQQRDMRSSRRAFANVGIRTDRRRGLLLLAIVETTVTRTPRRTASSMSMLPLTSRCPEGVDELIFGILQFILN